MAVQRLHALAQRTAHDQPHHHLDALRSGFAQIFDMRDMADGIIVRLQQVEKAVVPFGIDQARARTLKLVAHPAGAPDLHVEVLRKAFDRARDRLAQCPAALARWRRIGDDIDRERDDRGRPGLAFAEHHAQRHGQAVVDIHLVDDRHVEFVEDQALCNMPGEIGMADDIGHLARTPAFVRRRIALAAADREGRDELHVEGGCMVVIDQDHNIRLFLLLPFAGPVVPGEDRAEIIVALLALVVRHAEQRHMAAAHTCGYPGHLSSLPDRTNAFG